jgi:hypothetical protein
MFRQIRLAFQKQPDASSAELRRAGAVTMGAGFLAFLATWVALFAAGFSDPKTTGTLAMVFPTFGCLAFVVWVVGVHRVMWTNKSEGAHKVVLSAIAGWFLLIIGAVVTGLVIGLALSATR